MLRADPRNSDVVLPYLNGEDVNTSPTHSPSRWVINFFDWPEERARDYPLPFEIVESVVKPEHETRKRREVQAEEAASTEVVDLRGQATCPLRRP